MEQETNEDATHGSLFLAIERLLGTCASLDIHMFTFLLILDLFIKQCDEERTARSFGY